MLKDIAAVEAGGKPGHSISEAVERWMREYAPRLKGDHGSKVRALLPYIRGRALDELPAVAEEVKAGFAGLKAATVNRRLAILRRVGNLASDVWDWIDQPIGRRVKLLPESNQRHVYLTPEQVEAIAASCTNPHAGDLVRMAAYTGIRHGHMLRLTHHDVQGDCIMLDTSSKTGRPLLLPLHPRVQAIAERLPLPISRNDLRVQWEAAREACGLGYVRWHDLRHSFASWLINNGTPIYTVASLMGHSSVQVTQRYAHLMNTTLESEIRKMK